MDYEVVPMEGGRRVVLRGALGLGEAGDLKAVLQEALAGEGSVVVDAAEVEEADLSCLQLLLAARRGARDRDFRVRPTASALEAVARMAGLVRETAALWGSVEQR